MPMGRNVKRRTTALAASVVALSMLVAACSGDDDDASDGAATTEAAEDATATTAAGGDEATEPTTPEGGSEAPAPSGDVPETLAIQVSEFATLNPFLSSGVGRGTVNAVMYQPLVYLDSENNIQGAAAESWEISPDGLTITFTLKQGLVWSDGEAFDADDVVWSLQKYMTSAVSTWATRIGGVVGQEDGTFGGIQKIDDFTVEVTLAKQNPTWLSALAAQAFIIAMLPEHVLSEMSDEELTTTEYFNTEPVTLGPYKFVEWAKDEYVAFERNDDWATPAAFPKLELKFLQSDVAAAQLETGDLMASSSIAPLDAERLAALDTVDVATSPGVYPEVLQFAVDNPVLQDPRVRQAMMYSLDLDSICSEVMLSYCQVHWNQVRLLAPEWAIPTDGLEPYEYNPEKAKELLAEAGWNPDQKVVIHNIGGADRVRSTEALIIQASFQAVGIKADIISTDSATFLAMAKDPALRGDFYMFINRGAHFTADPNEVAPYTRCSTFYPNGANLSYYCDPELDALWDAGLTSTDPEVRAPIYHEAFQRISANPDVVNLYWPDTMITYNTSLTGLETPGMAEFFTWNIADWGWSG